MTEPTGPIAGPPPSSVRPGRAFVALGVAVVAAIVGTVFVLRAARHMPPVPVGAAADSAAAARRSPAPDAPARPAGGGGGARPEYPRLQ